MSLSNLNVKANLLIAFFFLITLASCQQKETIYNYYNIDSLLRAQSLLLTEVNASLQKSAEINSQHQDTLFAPPDSAAWHRELAIFADIGTMNKTIYKGRYLIKDRQPDTGSNLMIQSFTTSANLPLVYLKVYYQETPSKLRILEAFYQEENTLMKSNRKMVMEFTDLYNKSVLTSYTIEGTQKMLVGDSVKFLVKGVIEFK